MTTDPSLEDPKLVYGTPEAVVARDDLSRTEKLEVLEQWEVDARRLLIAEDENMAGGESSLLQRVLRARRQLEASRVPRRGPREGTR